MAENAQPGATAARRPRPALLPLLAAAAVGATACAQRDAPYGLDERPETPAYLGMPSSDSESLPRLLSQTGAFVDTAGLEPAPGLIPYDIVFPFWSDGATKSRWVGVPSRPVGFARTGEWRFPGGTVFVKHFDLPVDEADPSVLKRVETRLLVVGGEGQVYGAVYKWRDDASDAELLAGALTEDIAIRTEDGGTRPQTWYYPSREDCLSCHTEEAGGVLGVKTRQMNREIHYPRSDVTDNQLRAWNRVGLFDPGLDEAAIPTLDRLAPAHDTARSLEDRARSYLDANCSQCHRPGGTAAYFDARYDTPLADQGLVGGPVVIDQGIDRARVISPNDIWRSIAYLRVDSLGDLKMPPLAHQTIDEGGVGLLGAWIQSLPGPDVLAPPSIVPGGGNYEGTVEVSITSDDAAAKIHYTLDGSAPAESDPLYDEPLELTGPTILRARAFREHFTRSITVQEVFIVGP